jgi:hypothetical protein
MNYQITFSIPKNASLLNDETKNIKDSLHEALCLAIYENDEKALDWLLSNVTNITDDENSILQPKS